MRIVTIAIGFGVGAYVVWKLGDPSEVLLESCRGQTDCVAAAPVAVSEARLPGLRVQVYDPAIEPRRRNENDDPGPVRISLAETPWILDGLGGDGSPPGPISASPFNVSLTGLGQPGAHGVCFALDGGKRRCVAFIPERDE